MDAEEIRDRAEQVGYAGALAILDEALEELDAARERDLPDWAALTFDRTGWLLELGRSGEAIACASRLIDAIGTPDVADADSLSLALLRLAEAYEADDDLDAAVQLGRSMSARFAATADPERLRAHLLSRIWNAHCLRARGEINAALTELEGINRAHSPSADLELSTPATWMRAETVSCLLQSGQLEAALATGSTLPDSLAMINDPPLRWSVTGICERLADQARDGGRLAESVQLLEGLLRALESWPGGWERRHHASISSRVTDLLIRLDRLTEAVTAGEQSLERHGRDHDELIRYHAARAATRSAEACLLLRRPDTAQRLVAQLAAALPQSDLAASEIDATVARLRSGIAWQVGGPGAAVHAHAEMIRTFIDNPNPSVQRLVAEELQRDCATQIEVGQSDRAAYRAEQLVAVVGAFPQSADLVVVAQACNLASAALLGNDQASEAEWLARAVIKRQNELLVSAEPAVCVTAYTLLSDALMSAKDPAALSEVWDGILALGAPALLVLEGLAEHYRARDDLRVVLLYTYIGRSAVLSELGRDADAEQVADELLIEFAADDDEQIKRILRDFRPGRDGSSDED